MWYIAFKDIEVRYLRIVSRSALCTPVDAIPICHIHATVVNPYKDVSHCPRLLLLGINPFVGGYLQSAHNQYLLYFPTIIIAPQRLHLRNVRTTFFFLDFFDFLPQ
jgi:hypothetical protein